MTILVLGASGFIGNSALNFFSKKIDLIGIDKIANKQKNILSANDFEKTTELISKNNFDIILNCAGASNISESFIDPITDFEQNTTLVQKVLFLLKKYSKNTKFINISSAAVYGNPASLPVSETATENPLSPYGFHKLLSEKIIKQYVQLYNIKALSVRIFSAYGPGLKRQLFYDLYKKFKSAPHEIELPGTGNESRDFIFIADIANALDILIQKADFIGEVYNLGSQQESFINSTAQLFATTCNYKGEIKFNNKQFEGYPLNWKADTAKLNSLGFAPKFNLEQGLQLYFDWLKNND